VTVTDCRYNIFGPLQEMQETDLINAWQVSGYSCPAWGCNDLSAGLPATFLSEDGQVAVLCGWWL